MSRKARTDAYKPTNLTSTLQPMHYTEEDLRDAGVYGVPGINTKEVAIGWGDVLPVTKGDTLKGTDLAGPFDEQLEQGAINRSIVDFHNDRVIATIGPDDQEIEMVDMVGSETSPPSLPSNNNTHTLAHIQTTNITLKQISENGSERDRLMCYICTLGILGVICVTVFVLVSVLYH